MIAIPDFGAGAMENWGLITYRETALLFKEGVSAAANKQRIAIVVSHELAHQWFGIFFLDLICSNFKKTNMVCICVLYCYFFVFRRQSGYTKLVDGPVAERGFRDLR